MITAVLGVVVAGAIFSQCATPLAGEHALQVARELHPARPGGGVGACLLHLPGGAKCRQGHHADHRPQALHDT